ncbi:PAS domain-containing protein [Haloarcula salina]|uniref:hybrid sensor histidine kinase/response regulator n=1 Tax=Haloarcula salina TaxID=1429914 RepID=UPI003C6F9EAA
MAEPIRVLHVDDAPDFADTVAAFLESAGDFSVVTATTPEDGLRVLDQSPIDCVVSDYEMPGRNGLEFFEAVREDHPDLPFILFTGKGSEEVASEAITDGVTDYLQKDGGPDQYTILANRVRNAVERRRARRERERSERRFEAVFEDPQTLVGVLDPDGTVRQINQTALDMVEASSDEVTGTPLWNTPCWPIGSEAVVREWVARAADGEYVEFEIDHTESDAEYSLHGFIRPVRDDDDEITSLVVSGRDVTERVEREEKLERTRNLLAQTEELASVGGWEIDPSDGGPSTGRPTGGFYRLHGLEPDGPLPVDRVMEIIHPADRNRVESTLTRLLEHGEPFDIEARIVPSEGETRWLRSIGVPVEAVGERYKCRGAMVDITDQKAQKAELTRKTDLLRHTQQIADVGGWELDIAEPPYEATWTDQLFEIFEIPPRDAMRPDEVLSFVHPDDYDRVVAETDQLIGEGEGLTQEYRIVTGEGNERWLRVISERPDDRDDVIRGATLDITEQKRTTQALRERERTLSQYKEFTDDILDAVDDVFFLLDERGRVRRWNESLERVTDTDGDDLASMDGVSFFRPEDRETVADAFETGDARLELPLETGDGETTPYEFVVDRVEHPEGGEWVAAIGRDISARREREAELARTNRQLQSVLETTPALVFVKDLDGRYQVISEQFREVIAGGMDDVIGRTDEDLFPESVAQRIRADDRAVIETGDPIEREEQAPTAHGSRMFLTLKSPVYDDDGAMTGICGVATDITERVEYKEHVERQRERLEEFASIVSHDLRNPLDVAMARLKLAREGAPNGHLDTIERSLRRMQELIDDLLTLAQQGETVTDITSVALDDAVEQGWRNVQTAGATLDVTLDRAIRADPTRLQQLFENLFRNGVVHGGDDVSVTVGELDDGTGFYVEDDGPGIPESKRERVFESGYSTSESGTGFGLAIVREIAEAHGWDVTVTESAEGGARFEIRGVEVDH